MWKQKLHTSFHITKCKKNHYRIHVNVSLVCCSQLHIFDKFDTELYIIVIYFSSSIAYMNESYEMIKNKGPHD